MILKIVGGILIIFSSFKIGHNLSKKYSNRINQLRDFYQFFTLLENEIEYVDATLNNAIQKILQITKLSINNIIKSFANEISIVTNNSVESLWTTSIEKEKELLNLSEEDIMIIKSFGNTFGCINKNGYLMGLKQIKSQLKVQEKKAEQEREKNEKMVRSFGLLTGIAITVILI